MPAAIHSVAGLGAALRAERKALGLNQADLALAAGVGLRFVVELRWPWCLRPPQSWRCGCSTSGLAQPQAIAQQCQVSQSGAVSLRVGDQPDLAMSSTSERP